MANKSNTENTPVKDATVKAKALVNLKYKNQIVTKGRIVIVDAGDVEELVKKKLMYVKPQELAKVQESNKVGE